MSIILDGTSGITSPTGGAPAFSVYSGTTQTITANTWTKVGLNTKNFDTNSNFDATTNYRFTPTISGYYQISWAVYTANTATNAYSQLYKNGSGIAYGSTSQPTGGVGSQISTGSFLVSMNGSTDYLELYAYSGSTNISSGSTVTYMTGAFVRSL